LRSQTGHHSLVRLRRNGFGATSPPSQKLYGTSSRREVSFQQRVETSLLEMTVSSQNIHPAAFAHDQNRTAIRQRPFFVRMQWLKGIGKAIIHL